MEAEERRAADLLRAGELAVREPVGADLVRRVGRRAWERPDVAVSERIFLRYKLGDPWLPRSSDDPIKLGPVSVRFGEERRQPAPHARPKGMPKNKPQPTRAAPRQSGELPEGFKAPRLPSSRSTPEPTLPPVQQDKGADHKPLVGKLPVRPDLENPQTQPVDRTPPGLAVPPGKKKKAGRFGLRATKATGPTVREIERPPVDIKHEPAPRKAPPPKIPSGADSLDDLFGAAADMGRMSLSRKKKKKDKDGDEPKE